MPLGVSSRLLRSTLVRVVALNALLLVISMVAGALGGWYADGGVGKDTWWQRPGDTLTNHGYGVPITTIGPIAYGQSWSRFLVTGTSGIDVAGNQIANSARFSLNLNTNLVLAKLDDATVEFNADGVYTSRVFYDIGDYGWVYEIDFAGEVVDEQTIRGTAVVSYPSVDSTTAYWLEYGGIRAEDCDQTLELELSFDD